jgi:hypothetical protein
VVSYLTLRPRSAGSAPAGEIAAVGEIEAVGESLGEFAIANELVTSANGDGDGAGFGGARRSRPAETPS